MGGGGVDGAVDKSAVLNKSMSIKCTLQQWCGAGRERAYGLWKGTRTPRQLNGPRVMNRVSHRAGRILAEHWKEINTGWGADLYWCRGDALVIPGLYPFHTGRLTSEICGSNISVKQLASIWVHHMCVDKPLTHLGQPQKATRSSRHVFKSFYTKCTQRS